MGYFYTDPIAVIWMAKHHGMRFDGVSDFMEILLSPLDTKFYISPESENILKYKDGDLLVAADSYLLKQQKKKYNELEELRNFLIEVLLGTPVATAGRKYGMKQGQARNQFLRVLRAEYPHIQPSYDLNSFYQVFDEFRDKLITEQRYLEAYINPIKPIIQREGIAFMWPEIEQHN